MFNHGSPMAELLTWALLSRISRPLRNLASGLARLKARIRSITTVSWEAARTHTQRETHEHKHHQQTSNEHVLSLVTADHHFVNFVVIFGF